MRRTVPTRKRGRKSAAASVSMFPFLAVLICTMGALIVLLVVVARQARLQAAEAQAAEDAQEQNDFETELELVQWRIEQLKISRRKTRSQLADARLVLGHIEDHARRLSDELVRLKVAWNQLQQSGDDGSRLHEGMKAELARVRVEIARAEQQLAQLRNAAAERRRSYAVVPYQGPHGTHRRPIYIECRAEGIVLQPEGIVLAQSDFQRPIGPGNPLAAALRATREYRLARRSFDPRESGEPYPLLLVRPGGIVAYYAARAAMKSWGSEFGYELIGDDWKLDFPAPDPEKDQVVRRAIESARLRQRRLATVSGRYGARSGQPEYTVSSGRGGVVRADGSPGGFGSGSGRPMSPERSDSSAEPGGIGSNSRQLRPPRESDSSAEPGGTPPRPGQWQPDAAAPHDRSADEKAGTKDARSLAARRGQGWGMPDAVQGSVPFRRSLRIVCHPDRLVVLPEKGAVHGKVIRLGPRTEDAIDELVAAVWRRIDLWGIAGRNMYWRPVLKVDVAPNAGQRFADLQILLDDSGLIVERKLKIEN